MSINKQHSNMMLLINNNYFLGIQIVPSIITNTTSKNKEAGALGVLAGSLKFE